jgi:hypothetical protein
MDFARWRPRDGAPVRASMWRLVPLLAVLGFLEVLVPWPNVAAFVLSSSYRAEVHTSPAPSKSSAVDVRGDQPQLLVQIRAAAP